MLAASTADKANVVPSFMTLLTVHSQHTNTHKPNSNQAYLPFTHRPKHKHFSTCAPHLLASWPPR
jgi:hypothetical protein